MHLLAFIGNVHVFYTFMLFHLYLIFHLVFQFYVNKQTTTLIDSVIAFRVVV